MNNLSVRAVSVPIDLPPARKDYLLDQALKETFPASDPIGPLSIN